jgi:hypothetical protein
LRIKEKKKFIGFTVWEVAVNIQKCNQVIAEISNIESMKLHSEKSYDNYILVLVIGQLLEKFKRINIRPFDYLERRQVKFTELEQQIALMFGIITENQGFTFHSAIINKMKTMN